MISDVLNALNAWIKSIQLFHYRINELCFSLVKNTWGKSPALLMQKNFYSPLSCADDDDDFVGFRSLCALGIYGVQQAKRDFRTFAQSVVSDQPAQPAKVDLKRYFPFNVSFLFTASLL